MSVWNIWRIGASALTAQRLRLDTVANNIANAETTKTEDGGPYQRRDVVFRPQGENAFLPQFIAARTKGALANLTQVGGVETAKIVTDTTPGAQVFDPTHPDANEEGYVTYPNVNIVVEMTNMMSATRSYEANLKVVDAAKRMATKALEIGK